MKREQLKKQVYDHSATARMSQKYHSYLANRNESRDRWSKLITTLLAAGSVGVIVQGFDGNWDLYASALVALVSAVSTAWGFADRARHHSGLKSEWVDLRFQAQALYREIYALPKESIVDDDDLLRRCEDLEKDRARIQAKEGKTDEILMARCFNKVMKELGHTGSYIELLPRWKRWWRKAVDSPYHHYRRLESDEEMMEAARMRKKLRGKLKAELKGALKGPLGEETKKRLELKLEEELRKSLPSLPPEGDEQKGGPAPKPAPA